MALQEASLAVINQRLSKLERENGRLKLAGVTALLVAASLFLMAQASQRKTLEANEFILKDGKGKVRGKLAMGGLNQAVPLLELIDERGTTRLQMTGGLGQVGDPVNISGIYLFDEHSRERVFLDADNKDGGALAFLDAKGSSDTLVNGDGMVSGSVIVSGPVTVSDEQGFQATLGTTDLVTPRTGETHKTSAASLVLFDKNKNVIWKAP